jgi:hypothetical protein
VDWTASCALVANVPQSCGLQFYEQFFSILLPSFAFAVAHIIGAAALYSGGGTSRARGERAAKLAVFTAIHVFPAFGWYLFYVGLAAGFLISVTIIGLVVAPFVGAMAAGFVSGTLLALAAGPSPRTLGSSGWKRLVWFYGLASALGPIVLFGGPLLALGLLTTRRRRRSEHRAANGRYGLPCRRRGLIFTCVGCSAPGIAAIAQNLATARRSIRAHTCRGGGNCIGSSRAPDGP